MNDKYTNQGEDRPDDCHLNVVPIDLESIEDDDMPVAPHNIDAEQALIGAILFDNECFNRITDSLKPAHFYDPVHQRIYESISGLITRGQLADAVVLKNRFEQDSGLAEIGGVEYLTFLLQNAPSGAAAPSYAKLIYELSTRRELIRIGGDIFGKAGDAEAPESAEEQIAMAEQSLFDLAESGGQSTGFDTFQNAVVKAIEMAAAAYGRDGSLSGISTGLLDMDSQLGGLHKSDLIILAGRPSMGKTALAANIAFDVAKKFRLEQLPSGEHRLAAGGRTAFFSLEMSSDQLATRLLAEHSGVPSNRIRRGQITPDEFEQVRDSASEIASVPLYIDDTGGLSIGALAARARRLKRTSGLDLIVVDYLQLLTGGSKMRSQDNRVQEITMITMGLKALAKELDVPVLALAQLSRQVEQREDKRPMLSDLRESGSIEQDADVVMFVFREEYYKARSEPGEGTQEHLDWQAEMEELTGKAEVIVGKQRHGPIGTIRLSFQAELTKFGNLARDDQYGTRS